MKNFRIHAVGAVLDTARKLKVELEHKGYKVSIATDPEAQDLSMVSDTILMITSADNSGLPVPQQERNISIIGQKEYQIATARNKLRGDYKEIIGESPQIFKVLQQIENFAETPLRVLIYGKTGTGKEMVARALHKNSNRSGKIISVNCAAIPEPLFESELFGHEKGAFTGANSRLIGKFERAHKGTLFLDEIGEMPLAMQPKLLRAIEDGEIERIGGNRPILVDVRILAATNQDLGQNVKDKTFREDLYYRLNMASIVLPTLAERQEDLSDLVIYFLEKHRILSNTHISHIARSTLDLLKRYPWPGNVRELENVIQVASCLAKGDMLLPEHLPENIRMYQKRPVSISEEISTLEDEQKVSILLGTTLGAMEEKFICKTLARLNGNRTKTAEILGIGIRTLQRKLKKYNV